MNDRHKLHAMAQALADEMRRQDATGVWVDENKCILRLEKRPGAQKPPRLPIGYEYRIRYVRRRVKDGTL